MNIKKNNIKIPGFTIVELLMVITVIGILAGISLVSYGAVQTRSKTDALKSDLTSAASQLASDLYAKNGYPATLAAVGNGAGVKISNGANFEYTYNNTSNPKTFCITGTNGTIVFYITQKGTAASGSCSDAPTDPTDPNPTNPTNPTNPANPTPATLTTPTRLGYTNDYSAAGINFNVTPSSTIPDGSWMVIAIVYTNNYTIIPPSDWTTLVPLQSAGTLRFMLYGKIKTSSDGSSYAFTGPNDQSSSNSTIMWGSGASPVSEWSVGPLGFRASNGTSTTNVSPAVTAPAKSLVLTISTDRTTANETNVTSITNATPWYFTPQTSSKIQTVSVSYTEPSTATTTSPVTVTYPNAQASNGMSLQLVLPAVTP
jgi:prepilin-type N-terminal cleavage/methylation domain-containing protein